MRRTDQNRVGRNDRPFAAPSNGVSPEDLHEMFRLIQEVCELGADAHGWRQHLQRRLLGLVSADMASGFVMGLGLDAAAMKFGVELIVETDTNQSWQEFLSKGDATANPVNAGVMARFGTDFTVTRQDLVDDVAWYASDFYRQVALPSDYDQHLVSHVCITPPGIVDVQCLARRPGRPPFTAAEVELVRLLHQELAHLWRKPDPLGVNHLPTRLRQTLHCIRRGLARKEIAESLNVSVHTAHLHEKTLFTRYGVAGRSELMALLGSSIRPTLLPLVQDNEYFEPPPEAAAASADTVESSSRKSPPDAADHPSKSGGPPLQR